MKCKKKLKDFCKNMQIVIQLNEDYCWFWTEYKKYRKTKEVFAERQIIIVGKFNWQIGNDCAKCDTHLQSTNSVQEHLKHSTRGFTLK